MEYSSEFFYAFSECKRNIFNISREDISKIRQLKSYKSDQSGYYSTMLQWRYEDNKDIVTKEELNRLYVCMQFITMLGKMSDKFMQDHDVKQYHINLMRQLYLDYDEYDDDCITMGFKRPFGNSYVIGDIGEEMDNCGVVVKDYDNNYLEDKCEECLLQFVDILDNFMKEFEMTFTSFFNARSKDSLNVRYDSAIEKWKKYGVDIKRGHSYLRDWEPDHSYMRDLKIKEILK